MVSSVLRAEGEPLVGWRVGDGRHGKGIDLRLDLELMAIAVEADLPAVMTEVVDDCELQRRKAGGWQAEFATEGDLPILPTERTLQVDPLQPALNEVEIQGDSQGLSQIQFGDQVI